MKCNWSFILFSICWEWIWGSARELMRLWAGWSVVRILLVRTQVQTLSWIDTGVLGRAEWPVWLSKELLEHLSCFGASADLIGSPFIMEGLASPASVSEGSSGSGSQVCPVYVFPAVESCCDSSRFRSDLQTRRACVIPCFRYVPQCLLGRLCGT